MKSKIIPVAAAAISLALSAVAPASGMSKTEYGLVIKKIEFRFKVAKIKCDRLPANAKDICMADAKGKANVAMAELAARKHPDARYDVHIPRAEAVHAVTRKKCDGSANAACVRNTEAARTSARNEVWTKVKRSKSHRTAREKSALTSTQRHY